MQAIFRQAGREMLMEVTAVDGPILRTEVSSGTEILLLRDYYRGLLPVAGTDGGRAFSFDFDTRKLDALFPLAVDNTVSFSGKLNIEGADEAVEVVVQASVKGEKTFKLANDTFQVMVVEIEQIYRGAWGVRTRTDTFYHAPALSMNLKAVTRDNQYQTYWYVTDIRRNGQILPTTPRRPGSVMI